MGFPAAARCQSSTIKEPQCFTSVLFAVVGVSTGPKYFPTSLPPTGSSGREIDGAIREHNEPYSPVDDRIVVDEGAFVLSRETRARSSRQW